ncbi:hypothetical protein V2A60_005883 [Cordyceps javanica]|uniref:Peptidase S1 and S6, chymotrypsin/Hap n=1 Tax=Cordyceps javanica TaxID=43265 RepID=A0A545UZH8_9HYPO|nr:peptidase S1 and S6, chymotrypsin/Hap [Cordyceps javanica]TQW06731.1 peptidase S1 and S6, chymotrypsin/Hap [Cordyceps javanica]
MKSIWGVSLATLALRLSSGSPLVIDQATFTANGGDMTDIKNSISTKNNVLRSYSYNAPWLVVGEISGCTATWLGDQDNWTYILTAAHCSGYRGEETKIKNTFKSWDGRIIASGPGTAYVPPERINKPPGMGGASTDIAILKLPTKSQIVDKNGRPLQKPILNDSSDEKGRDVIFVGYGSWGAGKDGSGGYWPATGSRRLYARARIDDIFELGHGMSAVFKPTGPSASWGRTAPGDSGSAWWQIRQGRAVIIGTTNGGTAAKSTGARVSKYKEWLKTRCPLLQFSSEVPLMGCIINTATSERYCLPPGHAADSLPKWIYGKPVYVDAAPGTAVELCDFENLSYGRIARFEGTVEHENLKSVAAESGETLDFSRPHSMRVKNSNVAIGCITELTTCNKYCLPAGKECNFFPSWFDTVGGVQVEALPGAQVTLSDFQDLSHGHLATFPGFVQNWELRSVKAENGQELDFSKPQSMRVTL